MIRSLLCSVPLLICTLATGIESLNCHQTERLVEDTYEGDHVIQIRGNKFEEFDWEISKELNSVEPGNIVMSPFSLKVVLAMLYEGAKGTTAQEIGNALELANTSRKFTRDRFTNILKSLQSSKGEYEIKIGSHVFIDEHAEPKNMYLCKLKTFYNSDMKKVNFHDAASATKEINNWARNVTEGHIQHLITEAETHSSTIMLLLNAVYFKGLWEIPFPENQTAARTFYLNDHEKVSVPMMNTSDHFYYTHIKNIDAQMIKLPYLGGKFAMYVVLPRNKTGLNTLINSLGPNNPLSKHFKDLYATPINLMMPKFEFDFTTSLRPTLEKLGIQTMFSSFADLSDIADSKNGSLVVSNVLQKAGISVTEIGTVAYAATVAELQDKFGGEEETVQFHVDRPFLFFIQDEVSGTTVFVGKVTNPEKAQVMTSPPSQPQPVPSICNGKECASNIPNKIPDEGKPQDTQESIYNQDRLNFFDADLLREVSLKEKGNFVISPASVKSLLGLVMEAAEGTTLNKLLNVLRLPHNMTKARDVLNRLHNVLQTKTTARVTVDSHAHTFVSKQYQINITYSNLLKRYHRAEVSGQDFSSGDVAAKNINDWISDRTRGMIPKLIDPGMITPETLAVLVSAIYFDGVWKTQFLEKDTKDMCFYSEPTLECQTVPTMSVTEDFLYRFDQALDAHVLQVPYEDERFSMVLVVPHRREGIRQLKYNAGRLSVPDLVRDTRLHEVNLKMPRFTVEHGSSLKDIMGELGLEDLFSDVAQLPYMVNNKPGRISAMVHKAKIMVSERGTKASAASAASVVPLSYGLNEVNLDVNHPFYYFIYERESKTVLFSGRLSTMTGATSTSLSNTNGPTNSLKPSRNRRHIA